MKVAIVGAGIAGGYLARLLELQKIDPDVYERGDHGTSCGCRSCGWGAPEGTGAYLELAGLELDDYLLEPMERMNFDGLVARTPLLTLNKPRLVQDLRSGLSITQHSFTDLEAEEYDVVVDATGIARALLPPCNSDLTLPTLQHRVTVKPQGDQILGPGVYGNQIPGLGYVWVFPLSKDKFHIGAGGIGIHQHEAILESFLQGLSGQFTLIRHCSCTGEVRVASPHYSQPLVSVRTRENGTVQRIIGVGESVGTVSPFTGEGIIYSLECARILADSWPDEKSYVSRVLSRFRWMKKERETLDYLLSQGREAGPRLRDRWRFYRNARRSGIRLPILGAFRRMGSLSRWVEGDEIR